MPLDDLNIYTLPTPAVTPPEGYVVDGKGRMVPEKSVRPQEMLEDQLVRTCVGFAVKLANELRRFRAHVFADAETFLATIREEYGVEKRGAQGKGNVTFTTFDGLIKMQVAVSERITFGPELQVAQDAFRACIADWTDGARDELRVLVDSAFEADKEGNVSRDAVFRLLRVTFDDDRWKAGQTAIRDSIRVVGSKAYCRFYVRETPDAAWEAVPVDLAAA
ncbi:MAG: DUF3164 family protein [Caenispirillum sp.]|nr:DUF3164 family protein [Caenispirillum sp.]